MFIVHNILIYIYIYLLFEYTLAKEIPLNGVLIAHIRPRCIYGTTRSCKPTTRCFFRKTIIIIVGCKHTYTASAFVYTGERVRERIIMMYTKLYSKRPSLFFSPNKII